MKLRIGFLIILFIFHSLSIFGVKKEYREINLEGLKK